MKNNTCTCPKCLGSKEIMEPKKTKGFEYNKCTLCNGVGVVEQQLSDDYIFSLDEENFYDDYDGEYESNNGW